jgi:hypothetical protein
MKEKDIKKLCEINDVPYPLHENYNGFRIECLSDLAWIIDQEKKRLEDEKIVPMPKLETIELKYELVDIIGTTEIYKEYHPIPYRVAIKKDYFGNRLPLSEYSEKIQKEIKYNEKVS